MVQRTKFEEELARSGREGDAVNSMISRFNREVAESGVLKEVKRRESFEKPSRKRRRQKLEAAARFRRKQKVVHSRRRRY